MLSVAACVLSTRTAIGIGEVAGRDAQHLARGAVLADDEVTGAEAR